MKIFKKPTDFAHSFKNLLPTMMPDCQRNWHSSLFFLERSIYPKHLTIGTNFVTTNTELLILMKIGFKLHSF